MCTLYKWTQFSLTPSPLVPSFPILLTYLSEIKNTLENFILNSIYGFSEIEENKTQNRPKTKLSDYVEYFDPLPLKEKENNNPLAQLSHNLNLTET